MMATRRLRAEIFRGFKWSGRFGGINEHAHGSECFRSECFRMEALTVVRLVGGNAAILNTLSRAFADGPVRRQTGIAYLVK